MKIMAIVDRHGLPLSVSTHAANHHEVRLVQLCFDFYMIEAKPENLRRCHRNAPIRLMLSSIIQTKCRQRGCRLGSVSTEKLKPGDAVTTPRRPPRTSSQTDGS
jgi:hypothetical protein